MLTIHRYELSTIDEQTIVTHEGVRFLSVAVKPLCHDVSIWALVDTDRPKQRVRVRIVGTGNPAKDVASWSFVGTAFQTVGRQALCWHVFAENVSP